MKNPSNVVFKATQAQEFHSVIKQRVQQYFETKNISVHANAAMITKTVLIMFFFLACYGLVVSNLLNIWALLGVAGLIGVATALIGFNITHDAIHGSYSSNRHVNRVLGSIFNVIGANDYVWKISHNIMHHTYTNIPDHDEDINQPAVLRLNPKQKKLWVHRFQHIYLPALYALTSLSWVVLKDFRKFFAEKIGKMKNDHPTKEYVRLFVFKSIYYAAFIAIPIIFTDLLWWQVLIGFVFMHAVQGILIAFVFQLAHIVEGPEFPEPDDEGQIENSWAVHQLYTTADFARNSWMATYFLGGLNFQIEHHLFPKICHIHYKHLAPIVEQTAQEFNLPYYNSGSVFGALRSHFATAKRMGNE